MATSAASSPLGKDGLLQVPTTKSPLLEHSVGHAQLQKTPFCAARIGPCVRFGRREQASTSTRVVAGHRPLPPETSRSRSFVVRTRTPNLTRLPDKRSRTGEKADPTTIRSPPTGSLRYCRPLMSSRCTETHREAHRRQRRLGFTSVNQSSQVPPPLFLSSSPPGWASPCPCRLVVSVPVLSRCFQETSQCTIPVVPEPRLLGAPTGAPGRPRYVSRHPPRRSSRDRCLAACSWMDVWMRAASPKPWRISHRNTFPVARSGWAMHLPSPTAPIDATARAPSQTAPAPPDHPLPCSPTYQRCADLMG